MVRYKQPTNILLLWDAKDTLIHCFLLWLPVHNHNCIIQYRMLFSQRKYCNVNHKIIHWDLGEFT